MTLAELATARQENVDINIAILNNGFLGMVRHGRRFLRAALPVDANGESGLLQAAEAYGIPSMLVTRRDQVEESVAFARSVKGPVLIEYQILKEEMVYPMVPSGAALDSMIRRPKPEER